MYQSAREKTVGILFGGMREEKDRVSYGGYYQSV